MKIGLLMPSVYASRTHFPKRIFAPLPLFERLADGLIERGHTVRVYGAPDIRTNATVVSSPLGYLDHKPKYHKFRRLPTMKRRFVNEEFIKHRIELATIVQAFEDAQAGKLDIIHCYHDSSMFLTHHIARLSTVPVVYTLHDPLPPHDSFEGRELAAFAGDAYISISDAQRKSRVKLNFVDTVYHGVDTDRIRFHNEHEDYALFVGRLVREKGLHTALEATKRTRVPFRIASTFTKRYTETQYYKEHIHPYMDSPRITRYSVISRKRLYDLYKRAKMLLFPIEWEEPFGMVMLEAMASGTPVIAYNRGSVSEIVRDGVTGFVVDESADKRTGEHIIKQHGIAGMCEAIRRIGEIDRAGCRRYVEEHFGIAQTTQSYEAVYRSLVSS